MESNTLSNFGWIIIAIVIFSIMLAFVGPFGDYMVGRISDSPKEVAEMFGFCQHESKSTVEQKIVYDANKHQIITSIVCNSCGEVISKNITGSFSNHTYSNNVCSECGYIHTHEFLTETSAEYHEISGDNAFHTVTSNRKCSCGETVTTEYKALHTYNDSGICTLCTHRKN